MGLLWDRNIDNGKGQVKGTNIPLDGSKVHVTQFNPEDNTRVSWNADGQLNTASQQHSTNQNVGRNDSQRH